VSFIFKSDRVDIWLNAKKAKKERRRGRTELVEIISWKVGNHLVKFELKKDRKKNWIQQLYPPSIIFGPSLV
jgi:hypothetical protein